MNKVLMFDNPKDFLSYLKSALDKEKTLSHADLTHLLQGSVRALEQLWTSQSVLVSKMAESVDCLNRYEESWGARLAQLYSVLECGQVTPEQMEQILRDEICKA